MVAEDASRSCKRLVWLLVTRADLFYSAIGKNNRQCVRDEHAN